MKKIENECVGCPPELGCLGASCHYRNVERYYCDRCGNETVLYEFDNEELCIKCIVYRLNKIEGSD